MTGNHALSSKSVHDESFVRPSFSIQSGQHAHQEQNRENSKSRDDQIFNWYAEHIASYHNPEISNHIRMMPGATICDPSRTRLFRRPGCRLVADGSTTPVVASHLGPQTNVRNSFV